MKIFETFECSGQILSNSLCQFWNDESIHLQILYPSSVSWKITSLYFLAQTIYSLLVRSPLKGKSLRFLSPQVKVCQISYASFETMSRFLSKLCIPLQFYERWLLSTFLAQAIYTLLKRSTLKWKFLRLSSAQIKIRLNSSFQFCNDKSIPLQILHHSSLSWHITPLWILSSYFSYFGLKDPIIIPILRL